MNASPSPLEILNSLIASIKSKPDFDESLALDKFSEFLVATKDIGPFKLVTWGSQLRLTVWDFGELFSEIEPIEFILLLDNAIENSTYKEFYEFVKSEILINSLPKLEGFKYLDNLLNQYEFNPELRHSKGQHYLKTRMYSEAIDEFEFALKKDPLNKKFKENLFLSYQRYIEMLIENESFDKAKSYILNILKADIFKANHIMKNVIVSYDKRIDDHFLIQRKLFQTETSILEKVNHEIRNERKHVIEILGFFSAIVAFILSTVSIGKQFAFKEAIGFLLVLGLVLILFLISMSLLFERRNVSIMKDWRFWILLCSQIVLLLSVMAINFA